MFKKILKYFLLPIRKVITKLVISEIITDDWFAYKGSPNKGEQLSTKDWLLENKNIKLIPFARYGDINRVLLCT